MMCRTIGLFFFLSFTHLFGQGFQSSLLNLDESALRFVTSRGDNLHLLGATNHWYLFNGAWQKGALSHPDTAEINFTNYQLVQVDDRHYAVERGLGKIFQLGSKGLQRIDKSFSMQNNSGHVVFENKGQLLSYGGYGFWNYHPYLVRYSWQNQEWNMVIHDQGTLPPGRTKPFFQLANDQLYLLGGEGEQGFLNDVASIALESMDSSFLGELNDFPYKTSTPWYVTIEGVNYYLMQDFNWLGMDIVNNQYTLAPTSEMFNDHSVVANPVLHQDSLYVFSRRNKLLLINVIAVSDFKTLFNLPAPLYNTDKRQYLPWILLALFGLFFFRCAYVIFSWKRRKKSLPILQENYLTLGRSILILNEIDKELLLAFMREERLSLNALSDLPSFVEYSKNYQKKAVTEAIKRLQKKISEDKRLREKLEIVKRDGQETAYQLKGEIVIYRGWYNHLFS